MRDCRVIIDIVSKKGEVSDMVSLYLCHVCKGKVAGGVFLVVLNNFKKLCLPLHGHSEFGAGPSIVVEGEGHDESLSIGKIII